MRTFSVRGVDSGCDPEKDDNLFGPVVDSALLWYCRRQQSDRRRVDAARWHLLFGPAALKGLLSSVI